MAFMPPLKAFRLISLYFGGTLSRTVSSSTSGLNGSTSAAAKAPSSTMFFVITEPAFLAILIASILYSIACFFISSKILSTAGYFSPLTETVNGIVGVVRNVSENYASVISLLNTKLGISVKLKKNGYFGSASWSGMHYTDLSVKEIPNHVPIMIGDTIITSGYSTIFPEGIFIGTINKFTQKEGSNFYNISVKLSTNFKTLSYVYVVGDLLKTERIKLETIAD